MQKLADISVTIAITIALMSSFTPAATIPVVNPGFEDISGESPFNEFTFGPLLGWDLYDPDNITSGGAGSTYFIGTLTPQEPDPIGNPGVYEFFPDGAAEGNRVGIAFNFEGSGGEGEYGMVQTLTGQTLQPSTTYTLQVEIGNIGSGTDLGANFYDLRGFPGYRVDLLAGGVVVASDNNSLAGSIDDGYFATSTVIYSTGPVVAPDQTLGIRLVNLNIIDALFPGSDLEVDFDNVRLDATPVPEPTSLLALLATLAMLRRRG